MPHRTTDIAHHRLDHLADGAPHRQDRGASCCSRRSPARSTDAGHHPRARSTSPARAAATTSPARRSRSCRTSTPSARGRRSATRTSRWTARGRCTRRGCGCSSATSTSRWRWVRAARRPPTPRSSTRWRWTRTTSRRSAPTPSSFAALQARALIDAGKVTERQMAEIAARSRARREGQPARAGHRRLRRRHAARRGLRARAAAPPRPAADHRRRVRGRASPGPTRRRELCDKPVWITGFAHCSELHYPGMRDLTVVAVDHARGQGGRCRRGPVEVAELQTAFTHEEPLLVEALGLGADVAVNPSGGPLAANPIMATGLVRVTEAARQIRDGGQAAHARALDVGSVPAAEPRLHPRRATRE